MQEPTANIGDFRNATPPMKAAAFDLALTKMLLGRGADWQAADTFGGSALHHSARSTLATSDILKELVELEPT